MAVVDALLALAESQGAQGLVIASGEAPGLVFGDETRPLSMPAVVAETVAGFVNEVASPGEQAQLGREGTTRCRYGAPSGSHFAVEIESRGEALKLVFSAGGDAPFEPISTQGSPTKGDASHDDAQRAEARIDDVVRSVVTQSRSQSESLDGTFDALGAGVDIRLLELLARLGSERASDLLLSSGQPPRLRIGGALHALDGPRLDDAAILALLEPGLHDFARERLERHGSVDLALALPLDREAVRFRVNLFRQERGLAAAFRPIRVHPPTLLDLALPERLYELAEYSDGLVLVTGPTGSGKSTTLVALVEHINRSAARHVVTLEDPVEYAYTSRRSLIHQREVGRHVGSFAEGLRAALREDPDVILVGEMRDPETIAAALTAAETGHLVLSTLHSADPGMAVDRMIDAFSGDRQPQIRAQLAGVLRSVLSQHLIASATPPLRVPAYERLVVTPAAANQIREGRGHQLRSTIQTGREDGMVSLEASLAELVRGERIDLAAAQRLARDVRMLGELVAG